MVAMPTHAFGQHDPNVSTKWFFGSLPREAVCTENLTPWLKLLPCQGRQGLTQLMDRPTLYGASYHAMRVHLVVHDQPQQDTCSADASRNGSCPLNPADASISGQQQAQADTGNTAINSLDVVTATLTQTLTLVLRPEQMHTKDHAKSTFSNLGKVVHPDIDLQRLFNAPGVAACSKASHTHIYFHLPKALLIELGPNVLDLHALDNKLYSVTPTPDTVVSSSSGMFLMYNVSGSKASEQQAEQCLQPSVTWHQQPDHWKAQAPPVQVRVQFCIHFGAHQERDGLISSWIQCDLIKSSVLSWCN